MISAIYILMAEEQGFEPWVGVNPQRFSRPSRSAAPASLRLSYCYLQNQRSSSSAMIDNDLKYYY